MANMDFPKGFETRLRAVAGEHTHMILDALQRTEGIPVSVRYNPFKTSEAPDGKAVKWCRYGRYLDNRPAFTLDPDFHAGNYYVQEASSMFVEHVFREVLNTTEVKRVLDMCAAPGGKATIYSALAGLESIVVANEPIRQRANILADNVRKWGLGNVVVTANDPAHFGHSLREWFDVAAVDAPCSGEGMFRKSEEARRQWSLDNVSLCTARQKRILADTWEALRPGGVLIYSTCTFNREENEDNISWMQERFDCEAVDIEIGDDWGIVKSTVGDIDCFRFYPGLVLGEGFFVCALRKGGQKSKSHKPKSNKIIFGDIGKGVTAELSRWVNQPEYMHFAAITDNLYGYYGNTYRDVKIVSETLTALHSGVCMGQIYGKSLKPDHSLALFHDVSPEAVPLAALSLEESLSYLRRKDNLIVDKLSEGINLVCFDSGQNKMSPLGWIKRIGQRANNLYPKSLAIHNETLNAEP